MAKKILVVDDEDNIRELFREELEDEGYEVIMASNGEEAIKMVEEQKPDLVTMDIRMPGMDGIEALRAIKERHRDLPMVMCTAYPEYRHDFGVWASEAYVVKSADLKELKEKIREVLGV